MSRYLFSVSKTYAFPTLRPLQQVLLGRGDSVEWFFEDHSLAAYARPGEKVLATVEEVMAYNPVAVFCANDSVCDFFPGVKVQLFHGMSINKRGDRRDAHFDIRGLFDLYCTHGLTSTPGFEEIARKKGYFAVAETGWPKIDNYFPGGQNASHMLKPGERPTILYATTFSRRLTSTTHLYAALEELISTRPWDWIITLHPMLDPRVAERYRDLAANYPNATFYAGDDNTEILRRADVMVCDSSSIIVEFMTMGKPVVTFRNTLPGPYLIDIDDPALLGRSIEKALNRPPELIDAIREYVDTMNPYMDGLCSLRVARATDDFIARGGRASLPRRQPLNLWRRWQLRRQFHYFPLMKKIGRLFAGTYNTNKNQ